MNSVQASNAYRQSGAQAKINPVKLIHLMYERALAHLEMAGVGIVKKDPKMRGENLGKAIAIITELNASVNEDDSSEAAIFLRGLYGAILLELPKAALSDDGEIVHQTIAYIKRLKEIWEQTAMQEDVDKDEGKSAAEPVAKAQQGKQSKMYGKSDPLAAVQGVSFSI